MDPSSRESTGSSPASETVAIGPKSCSDCRTTKTPLWRGGPSGPKSLCNACGIRYRKTRPEPATVGVGSKHEKKKMESRREEMEMSFKLQLIGIKSASDAMIIRQRRRSRRTRRRMGEVEKAAVLLMALSSGLFL